MAFNFSILHLVIFILDLIPVGFLKLFILFLHSYNTIMFNSNSAIFQLYHGENKLIINEMMMSSALF
jgi:hypothetical protein